MMIKLQVQRKGRRQSIRPPPLISVELGLERMPDLAALCLIRLILNSVCLALSNGESAVAPNRPSRIPINHPAHVVLP